MLKRLIAWVKETWARVQRALYPVVTDALTGAIVADPKTGEPKRTFVLTPVEVGITVVSGVFATLLVATVGLLNTLLIVAAGCAGVLLADVLLAVTEKPAEA